jgi:hypothetical protein
MPLEILLTVIFVVLSVGEFFVWYSEILWHREDEKVSGDRRNWFPPR